MSPVCMMADYCSSKTATAQPLFKFANWWQLHASCYLSQSGHALHQLPGWTWPHNVGLLDDKKTCCSRDAQMLYCGHVRRVRTSRLRVRSYRRSAQARATVAYAFQDGMNMILFDETS